MLRSWGWNLTIVGGQPKAPIVASIVYGIKRVTLFRGTLYRGFTDKCTGARAKRKFINIYFFDFSCSASASDASPRLTQSKYPFSVDTRQRRDSVNPRRRSSVVEELVRGTYLDGWPHDRSLIRHDALRPADALEDRLRDGPEHFFLRHGLQPRLGHLLVFLLQLIPQLFQPRLPWTKR